MPSLLRYTVTLLFVLRLFAPAIAGEPLPLDAKLNVGKLDNGLTYYVRENKHPEARAELRLVVNAGSVLETDDERGLAHFLEHMVFNGSAHFPPGELVKFLESIGLRFGADLNAYTGFDETVFILPVPTDKPELLDQAFLVLSDWARGALIKAEEVDKERGVVLDEWRRGRDADARMRDKQFPILFHGSRYAERLPIGLTEIIEKAPGERVRGFYDRWYQPDNMAVIAVGDFNADLVKKLIEKHFGAMPRPEHATVRPHFPVPDHDDTLFALTSDPEATQTVIQVAYKAPQRPYVTDDDFRNDLVTQCVGQMLTARFGEISRQKDPPFLFAGAQLGGAVRGASIFGVFALTQDGKAETGLAAVLRELKRAREHGFTTAELDRMKAELLAYIERAFNERDKAESASLISDYLQNFLDGRAAPGIEREWALAQRLVPTLMLTDVNRELTSLLTQKNRVLLANLPEKAGVQLPTKASFEAVLKEVEAAKVTAYEDHAANRPLIAELPKPGSIAKSERYEPVDAQVITLGNGMTVWVKQTDFKNDQVVMQGYAFGGLAMAKPEDYASAQLAVDVVEEAGVGGFNPTDLEKLLAGKVAGVTPFIEKYQQGFSLTATPKDLETAFQLLHLYFTAPNRDTTAFDNLKNRIQAAIVNKEKSPEALFSDRVPVINRDGHYSAEPWSMAKLAGVELDRALAFYRQAFANAGDFTFFIVGNVTVESVKPLLEQYLASLPRGDQHVAGPKAMGVHFPSGIVNEAVKKGREPKALTHLSWPALTGMEDAQSFRLRKACEVLQMRLLDVLREQTGQTYSVSVSWAPDSPATEYATTSVSFGSAPDQVESMVKRTLKEIEKFKAEGPTDKELAAIKEQEVRQQEVSLKQNDFWASVLMSYHALKRDLKTINDRIKRAHDLTAADVKAAAAKFFPKTNYTVVTLTPEAKE